MPVDFQDVKKCRLIDLGDLTVIFPGDEDKVISTLKNACWHPDDISDLLETLAGGYQCNPSDWVMCYLINGAWYAVRDYEIADIQLSDDGINELGDWNEIGD